MWHSVWLNTLWLLHDRERMRPAPGGLARGSTPKMKDATGMPANPGAARSVKLGHASATDDLRAERHKLALASNPCTQSHSTRTSAHGARAALALPNSGHDPGPWLSACSFAG
eukprot:11153252-Alexandrium_andersonii.AAC.1